MIVNILVGYFQNKHFLYILSIICLIVFISIVFYHHQIHEKLNNSQAQCDVLLNHIMRLEYQWDQFDNGHIFLNDKDYCSMDLDVFGHHSLYQMINICFTDLGKKRLAEVLTHQKFDENEIKERQEAVLELSQHLNFVLQMQTYGRFIDKKNEKSIYQFIQSDKPVKTISKYILIIPIITCIALLLSILSLGQPYSAIVAEVGIVMQLSYAFICMPHHNCFFKPIAKLNKSLKGYFAIFDLIEKENFESKNLKHIQNMFLYPKQSTLGIGLLSQISQGVTYRQNIFAFVLLNALFSFDVILIRRYQKWFQEYGQNLQQWIETLAELEVYMSLSVTAIDDFDVCMPTVKKDMALSFENLRHPLIECQKAVGNTWTLKTQTNIITGSNMSGKTTFMRTIGLNLILAYAGGFVFGDKMICSLMRIYTSMRVKDNVEEGISTFYGELLRIKDMIDESENTQLMICFIDEIFKGTNSLDRLVGAKATIEKLSLPHCLLFMTTHDFELCQLNNVEITNYHFDEFYKDEKIYFDYHIKDGQSQSTNGQFLLKQLGIMNE